jgi:hypothetical protein
MIVSANAYEYSAGAGIHHDLFVTKPIDLSLLLGQIGTLLELTWIEQSVGMNEQASGKATRAERECSRQHLDDLYRLGRIGHVRGIEAKLRELELEDPANETVTAQLRELISNFDFKRYMNVLENLRASG